MQVSANTSQTNAITDIALACLQTTGTPAAGLGIGLCFHIEDAGGIEEQASIDVVMTTVTDAAEDSDMVFYVQAGGAITEAFRLVGLSSATTGTRAEVIVSTAETNGIIEGARLELSTSGTPAAGLGTKITFNMEDLGGAEEQGSIASVFTTVTDGAEDVDMVFTTNAAGGLSEVFRLVGLNSATTGTRANVTVNTAETNGVIEGLRLALSTSDTPAAGLGTKVAFNMEDLGGLEEQASIAAVFTDVTDAAEDVDIVVNVNKNGTLTEVLRIDGDGDTIDLVAQTITTVNASGSADLTDWADTFNGADGSADEDPKFAIKIKVANTDYYVPAFTSV